MLLHWRPGSGIEVPPAKYLWKGRKLNSGRVTTFSEKSIVSENRLTVIPKSFNLRGTSIWMCYSDCFWGSK